MQECIHQLFELQVRRAPERIALLYHNREITYSQLNVRSNQIANYLRKVGVVPERFVGVYLERSADVVVALLGILKAGGAYVYLDPSLPAKRVDNLLNDSQPPFVVGSKHLRGRINYEGIYIDIECPGMKAEDEHNPVTCVGLDSAACVLYTSGSTGNAKGVVLCHRSLTARLNAGAIPDIQEGDVCCLNSSFGSGITASRLFLPLVLGAPVVLLSDSETSNIGDFVRALERYNVTSAFVPLAVLQTILTLDRRMLSRLSALRALTVTGAALTPAVAEALFRALPHVRLINVYGSAEIGTTAALRIITADCQPREVSIGRCVPGTELYLLNEDMSPVPFGETGEIVVGAKHLARGYLNQPHLTREKFLPNPFRLGRRVYRTGDIGRYLPNGEIQFLGRRDHQVKIHGQRVELGEVERVLELHVSVNEAVVSVEGVGEDKRLIAYLTVGPGEGVSFEALRHFLRDRLPNYMVPWAFMLMAEMPRTLSGKVDRASLPSFDQARSETESVYEAPRDEVETALAETWSHVLSVKIIGIDDNFLALGGDSLAATQAAVEIEKIFGVVLRLNQIFDSSVAQLASYIKEQMNCRPRTS
jgi:amino acid adenylation domain-containing protein